jgi:Sulfotransferase domain
MNKEKKILPNLIIAGVNKAGTTSLFTYLSKHKEVFSSEIKETCFYLTERYNEESEPLENYYKHFEKHNGQKIIMEATPGYFYGDQKLVNRIRKEIDNVKVIVVLREPVTRLISHFKFVKSRLQLDKNMSFETYINKCKSFTKEDFKTRSLDPYFGLKGGEYIEYIEVWKPFFPDNFMLIDFDNLKKNPLQVLTDISNWIGIDPSPFELLTYEIENKTKSFGNKFFHGIALKVNDSLERTFRKNPNLKKKLREQYFKINGKKSEEKISQEEIENLENYFDSFNKRLKEYLKNNNFTIIPQWLNKN